MGLITMARASRFIRLFTNPAWRPGADAALYGKGGFYDGNDESVMARTVIRGLIELGVKPEGAILDYGCGHGALVELLMQYGPAYGYDPLTRPCMPSGMFDYITMVHVMEHCEDPAATLRDVHEIMGPSATLCIVCHNAIGRPNKRADEPWHRWVFGKNIIPYVEAQGFKFVKRLTWGGSTCDAKWLKEAINAVRKALGLGDVQMVIFRAK